MDKKKTLNKKRMGNNAGLRPINSTLVVKTDQLISPNILHYTKYLSQRFDKQLWKKIPREV